MGRGQPRTYNLDLFTAEAEIAAAALAPWPDAQRFPLNIDHHRVAEQVLADLRASANPLIVTGYAALDRLIDFVAGMDEQARVRILIGFEPFPSRRETFEVGGHSFPREVQHYWLDRGISLLLSAAGPVAPSWFILIDRRHE